VIFFNIFWLSLCFIIKCEVSSSARVSFMLHDNLVLSYFWYLGNNMLEIHWWMVLP